MELTIDLQPKQAQLYELMEHSPHTNIGWGGARGGGKSRGSRDIMLLRRLEHPKSDALIFRKTYGELLKNHIDPLFKQYPALRPYYNVSDKILKLPYSLGSGNLVFGHAENPGDILRFRGQEFMDQLIDEATHLTQAEIDELRMCRRWTGVPDRSCKMVMTCNPGGVGHTYIKRVMIDRIYQENEMPEAFVFIPAFGWDNVEWARSALAEDGLTAKDYYSWSDEQRFRYFITRTQYGRDLNALPENLRIQHLLGRWDFFEGQVFPELNDKDHNLDNYLDTADEFTVQAFSKALRKVSGHDHATTGITAHILDCINSDEDHFAVDEYYQADRLISEHAAGVKSMLSWHGRTDYTVVDPSTEAKTLQNVHDMYSVQDAYTREGLAMVAAFRSSIGVGIDLIKEFLRVDPLHRNPFTQQHGSARLFISRRRCPNLWKEMSELQVENDEGRIKYIGADHAVDCLRYILMSRPRAAERKKMDVSKLPTMDQVIIRSHDKWASTFGKQADNNRWF